MKNFFLFVLAILISSIRVASAEVLAPVVMTQSESGFAPVIVGDTTVEIPFNVSSYDTMIFRIIAPVNGVALSLVNPLGSVAVASNSPLIGFTSGSGLSPPKPGGIFTTLDIPTPSNGVWKLRLTFPAATEKTYMFATWLGKSAYESGIITDNIQYITGETGLFGYLVTNNGQPITALSPTITVTPKGGGAATTQAGKDDGLTVDGLANDGLYSAYQIFTAPGKYAISGNVSISTPSGPVLRMAETTVDVVNPLISMSNSSVSPIADVSKGCNAGVQVTMTMNVSQAGTYIIRGNLQANDKTLSIGETFELSGGNQSVTIKFPMDLIKEQIGTASVYSVTEVQGYKIDPALATVRAFNAVDLGAYSGVFCVDPISIIPDLSVTETFQGGLISALNFKFPVVVQAGGNYYVTLHVVGPNGEPIELISLTLNLVAGNNDINFIVPGNKFATINGPYRVVSVIVDGNGQTASIDQVGQTKAYPMSAFGGSGSLSPIPTLSEWGLIILSLLLAILSFKRLQRGKIAG